MTDLADLVVDTKSRTGEGPVWCQAEQALWWLDINGRQLHRYEPGNGRHDMVATPARVGCFALRSGGGMVAAMEHAIGALDSRTGAFEPWCTPEAERPQNRFNDGRCDRRGRLLAGSMSLERAWPSGVLWRLTPGPRAAEVASGVMVANGLAWSPDDKIMYWADSAQAKVWQFDYDLDDGMPYNRRPWLEHPPEGPLGRPDGAAVDSEGCYWSARWLGDRVVRFTPAGKIDREIRLPCSRVTMCAFGGADLKTLYITTATEGMTEAERTRQPLAGGLFAAHVDVAGLPEPEFAG